MCKLDGYLFIGRSRAEGSGSGVGIYFKENIIFERRKDLEHDTLATLWTEIFIYNAKSILFGCYYRPQRPLSIYEMTLMLYSVRILTMLTVTKR